MSEELKDVVMDQKKRVALVAHDNKKKALLEWVGYNKEILLTHDLYATGSTGSMIAQALGAPVHCFKSGPLGGDQQIGARIAEGGIDLVIFFWDPLEPHPHDVDVKALLRIAVVYNIPIACNRSSADFMISSPLLGRQYARQVTDFELLQDARNSSLMARREA